MKAQHRGKIVNISSSRVGQRRAEPPALHHVESRRHRLHRRVAREVGEFGITVNALTPGMTQSETQVASSSGNYLRLARRRPCH